MFLVKFKNVVRGGQSRGKVHNRSQNRQWIFRRGLPGQPLQHRLGLRLEEGTLNITEEDEKSKQLQLMA